MGDIRPVERCLITQILYRAGDQVMAALRLQLLDAPWRDKNFSVLYFDFDDVPDFMIPYERYNAAMQHTWRPGARCLSFYDDGWYVGEVLGDNPSGTADSPWRSLVVQWRGNYAGTTESMSPWEIEPVPAALRGAPADEQGRLDVDHVHTYPLPVIAEATTQRLLLLVQQLRRVPGAELFAYPVDYVQYPTYLDVVRALRVRVRGSERERECVCVCERERESL